MLVYLALALAWWTLLPSWLPLMTIAPLLVTACYRKPLIDTLYIAAAHGTLLDLLSAELPLGTQATAMVLSVLLLYQCKQFLFADSLSTVPIMTAILSLTSTSTLLLFRYAIGTPIPLTGAFVVTDLLLLPFLDALLALVGFTLPLHFLPGRRRAGGGQQARPV